MQFTAPCAYCKTEFTQTCHPCNRRLCCTRSCAAKLSKAKKGQAAWDKESIELLEDIAGTVPRPEIVKVFNRRAKRRGLPIRTETALLVQIKRLGLSINAEIDNLKASTLAHMLGIHRDRVRAWCQGNPRDGVRRGGLLPYRKIGNMTAIKVSDFVKFAEEYPEKLTNIDPRNLSAFLKDDLILKILELGKPTTGHSHKILDVQTGQVFRSGRAAARAFYGERHHILRQAKQGAKAYGREFRIVGVEGVQDYSSLAPMFRKKS